MTDSKTHDVHKKEVSNNWNSIQFNIPRTISDFDNSDTSKHNFVAFQDKSAFKKVIDTGGFSENVVFRGKKGHFWVEKGDLQSYFGQNT